MKKLLLLLLAAAPFFVKATNYTSVANGNWSHSSTWSPIGVPGSGDNVTIASTVALNSNESVNSITINSSETLTVSNSSILSVYGNFTNNGTFTYSTGTVSFDGSSTQAISGATTFYNLTIASSNTVTLAHAITVKLTFLLSSGTFDVSASNYGVTVDGNFTRNSGSFNAESGTVTFNGSANEQINGTNATTFYNLTEDLGASTDSLFLTHPITVNNTLTITQGVLDCEKNQLTNSATPTISISPSTSTVCAGGSASLSASGYTTYVWAPSTSLSSSTGSSATATPYNTTTYTVYGSTSSKYQCAASTGSTGNVTVNYCNHSCSTAAALGSVSSVSLIPINHAQMWFSFTASGNIADIVIHNKPDTLPGRIVKAILYSGTCSSLTVMQSDTIHQGPGSTDSIIVSSNNNLTSGNTYLLELIGDDSTSGRTFNLRLKKGASSCPAVPACDFVSNGNFSDTIFSPISTGEINATACWVTPLNSPDYYNTSANVLGIDGAGVPYNYFNISSSGTPEGAKLGTPDHTGTNGGYAGLYTFTVGYDYREYIQEQLPSSMNSGYTYNISFWTFWAPVSAYKMSSSDMGLYLSNCAPNIQPALPIGNEGPLTDCTSPGSFITPQITGSATAICPSCTSVNFNDTIWAHITGQYTAKGGEDYITIGNFENGTNTFTTYNSNYDGNFPGNGASYYYVDDVSITKGVSINSQTGTALCSGNSTVLSVSSGWSSYTWNTGATTSSITVSPTSTTTYSVSVSDGSGCNANNTFTLTVISGAEVSPQFATICIGDSITLSVTGADNYTWSPSTGLNATTGSTVIANPVSSTTYTVTGTGCSFSESSAINVNPNCCLVNCQAYAGNVYWLPNSYPTGLNITSGTTSSYFLGSNPTPVTLTADCPKSSGNTGINIRGIFTVNDNCIIDSCNVAMGEGAEIIVDSLCTLTITNARLYACDSMWQGILVKPGGTLIVDSTSIIEDAQIAIEAKSGVIDAASITVLHSTFNNNYYDIKVDPYFLSAAYPITLHNVNFTTSSDAFSLDAYLKPPYTPITVTNTGVYLDSVLGTHFGKEAITIGDHSSSADSNHFSNMQFGVNAFNSNFAVFNNSFNDLEGRITILGGPAYGMAVCANATAYDTTNVSTYCTAIIGSSGANYGNIIKNCFRGVDVTDYVHLQVDSNYFYNSTNTLMVHRQQAYGDHAVYFKTEGQDSIWFLLGHNTIENFSTGIHVLGLLPFQVESYYNSYTTGPYQYSFINNNYIHADANGSVSSGIQLENTYGVDRGFFIYIQENKVDSAEYCIYLNEINNSTFGGGGGPVSVNDNADLFVLPSTSGDATQKAGIYMTDCNNYDVFVNYNTIHADGTYIGSAAAADTNVVGISTYMSVVDLCGNNTYNLGQDVKFTGDCSSSQFDNNTMGAAYDGLVMEMNGQIYTQGYTSIPASDVWDATGSFNHSQTATYSSDARNSKLYLTSATFPTLNYTNNTPGTDNYFSGTSLLSTTGIWGTCFEYDSVAPILVHGAIKKSASDSNTLVLNMRMTIHDSIPLTGLVPETQFMMKQRVYDILNSNQGWLGMDSALQNFYNRSQNTSIGIIHAIEHYIQRGDYRDAQNLNSNFTPQTTIEQNYKSVADITLNTFARKVDTATAAQLITLQDIANQCPLSGGRAVFEARALLNGLLNTNILYDNNACYGGTEDHRSVETQITTNRNAIVYPNPANTLLNVQVTLKANETATICLYNGVGEVIRCQTLKASITTLPINDLSAGIYYYRITDSNGELIKADKVMVVH